MPMPVQPPAPVGAAAPVPPLAGPPSGRARRAHGPAHRQGLALDAAARDGAERQPHAPRGLSPPVPAGCSLLPSGPSGTRPGRDPCLEAAGAAGPQRQARGWRSPGCICQHAGATGLPAAQRDRGTGISRGSFQSIDRFSSTHFFSHF